MKQYILNRLMEPSTWRGIIALLMSGGIAINPEMIEQIISVGVGAIGLILAFKKDANSPDA